MSSKNDGKLSEGIFDELYKKKAEVIWYSFVDTFRARSFVPAQPADRLLIFNGRAWLVEIKSSIDPVRFPLKNISKKQIGFGRYWRTAGVKELFIIHRIPTNQFYFIPFKLIDELFKAGKASIKWEDIYLYIEEKEYEFYKH